MKPSRLPTCLPGRLRPLALASLLLASPAALAADELQTYTLSKQYGSVLFRVMFQDTLYMVGLFQDFAGALRMQDADLATAQLEASVNMASLHMGDSDVAETLTSSSVWFNTPLYPQASFTSTEVEVTGEREVDFIGELEFMGMKQPWVLHAEFFGGSDGELAGSTVGMHATGTFNRTDFGLDQYLNMAADEVEVEVNVKFNRD